MKKNTIVLTTEAIVFGGPPTALAVYGVPTLLAFAVASLPDRPFLGALGIVGLIGSVWALAEYWRLALANITKQPYVFGARFWLAVAGAIGGVGSLWGAPPLAVAALFVPTAVCTAHFSILQMRGRLAS